MIRAYVRQRKKRLFLDVVFVLIFAVCFYLMGADLALVWYPAVLCFVFACLYVLWDFWNFSKKHKLMKRLWGELEDVSEFLPLPENTIGGGYRQLVLELFSLCQNDRKEYRQKIREHMEYIALWTHQIKTPITAMQLLLQESGDENSEEKRKELLDKLFEIEQYADMSLQYMRLDTMTSDLLLQEYRLFDIVKQAVKYFARTFISKKISLHMKESDTVVVTDEKWMLFVIKQVLSNALKYTDSGFIAVFMHPDREQTLVIEDTGIGIAAEDLPRIYERGFTGMNGRIQKKSTGIGLYLSRMILDRLGHGILITSEEGKGTRIEINFCV